MEEVLLLNINIILTTSIVWRAMKQIGYFTLFIAFLDSSIVAPKVSQLFVRPYKIEESILVPML